MTYLTKWVGKGTGRGALAVALIVLVYGLPAWIGGQVATGLGHPAAVGWVAGVLAGFLLMCCAFVGWDTLQARRRWRRHAGTDPTTTPQQEKRIESIVRNNSSTFSTHELDEDGVALVRLRKPDGSWSVASVPADGASIDWIEQEYKPEPESWGDWQREVREERLRTKFWQVLGLAAAVYALLWIGGWMSYHHTHRCVRSHVDGYTDPAPGEGKAQPIVICDWTVDNGKRWTILGPFNSLP